VDDIGINVVTQKAIFPYGPSYEYSNFGYKSLLPSPVVGV
jgi:hypothetical protein